MTSIALIRHGPTEWNERRRLQGQADIPLSANGRSTVLNWRVPIEFSDYHWVASPLTRAQQTAKLLDLSVETESALIEMDWGDWDGHTHTELKEKYGDDYRQRADMGIDLRPDGGESPRDVRARVQTWVERIAAEDRATGAVAHQGIIRAMISLATGWNMVNPPPHKMDWASVHLFVVAADATVSIDRLNISLVET